MSGPLGGAVRALADVPHLSPAARLRALLFAGGHALAPVDDGVARVLSRLYGVAGPKPRVRRAMRRRVFQACGGERERLAEATVMLAHHAGHACTEHAPHCPVCPLAPRCHYARTSRERASAGAG